MTTGNGIGGTPREGIGGNRGWPARLLIGTLALGALAVLLSQSTRLPGPAGDAIRENAAADREATALFYTEVDGWSAWPEGTPDR